MIVFPISIWQWHICNLTNFFNFSVLDSPADRARLQPGDIITSINGKQILNSGDVYSLLEGNEDLDIIFVRQNQILRLNVTPEP